MFPVLRKLMPKDANAGPVWATEWVKASLGYSARPRLKEKRSYKVKPMVKTAKYFHKAWQVNTEKRKLNLKLGGGCRSPRWREPAHRVKLEKQGLKPITTCVRKKEKEKEKPDHKQDWQKHEQEGAAGEHVLKAEICVYSWRQKLAREFRYTRENNYKPPLLPKWHQTLTVGTAHPQTEDIWHREQSINKCIHQKQRSKSN